MHQNHPGISRIISLSRIHIWFPNIDHEITLQELEYAIKTLGIKHIPTAAYHQTSNGQAERYVQTVKNKTLKERLFDFLTSYRSTSHTVTNRAPAEIFIGRSIRTRIDLIKPHQTLGINSNPHKNNLTLCTLSQIVL